MGCVCFENRVCDMGVMDGSMRVNVNRMGV